MFVKNKEKVDFHYRKGTYLAVLKAMTVSYVDETKVTAEELLACYGQRIDIISRDLAMQIAPHVGEEKKEVKKDRPHKTVETVKKEDLNDAFIEKVLGEIEGETQGEAVIIKDNELESNTGDEEVDDFLNGKTDKLPEGTEEFTIEEVREFLGALTQAGKNTATSVGDEANTRDKAIDDFLNGKTDELPEGTQIISEEEALKLQEEAEAQKAKEEAERLAKEAEAQKAKTKTTRASKTKASKSKTGRGKSKSKKV